MKINSAFTTGKLIISYLSNCLPLEVTVKFITTRLKSHFGGLYCPWFIVKNYSSIARPCVRAHGDLNL
jgi:hypothetical protein